MYLKSFSQTAIFANVCMYLVDMFQIKLLQACMHARTHTYINAHTSRPKHMLADPSCTVTMRKKKRSLTKKSKSNYFLMVTAHDAQEAAAYLMIVLHLKLMAQEELPDLRVDSLHHKNH